MDVAFPVLGFLQAPATDLIRKWIRNRKTIKELIQDESAMEHVICLLSEMLKGHEGGVRSPSRGGITALITLLAKKVQESQDRMQQIKGTYRDGDGNGRRRRRLLLGPSVFYAGWKMNKLHDQVWDVVLKIVMTHLCARVMWVEAFFVSLLLLLYPVGISYCSLPERSIFRGFYNVGDEMI